MDEAAHYDPNRVNSDGTIGGWWNNANSSDSFPAYGPVGVHARTNFPLGPDPNGPLASANAAWGTEFPGYSFLDIPFDAYENAVSSFESPRLLPHPVCFSLVSSARYMA